MELVIRFDYGRIVPWVRKHHGALFAVGGPDSLELRTPVLVYGKDLASLARFEVAAGDRVPFALAWQPSEQEPRPPIDVAGAIASADRWWRAWSARCAYDGEYHEAVVRSLITLKALTYLPTGGIVAAPTTSIPERVGGARNWDYRYCWLRDATFTLYAMMLGGYREEARAWREWLLRAVAGSPWQLQIMYGVAGERRLPELTLDWLPGYEGSRPVRTGNAAVDQFQLDVYGEVCDAMYFARKSGIPTDKVTMSVLSRLLEFLEGSWHTVDQGIWEMRGPRRHFVHSKIMSWTAFDRAVKTIERFGTPGPLERWRAVRDEIHREVCERGYDRAKQTFTQSYGSGTVDASLLLAPLVGFLPVTDERMTGTIRAIERELIVGGLVRRYRTDIAEDGLPPGEGAFLACSFWLADNYALAGRRAEARALFERLLALRNDVGLLSEEYDPIAQRHLGNFPQAFSHVGLINTAFNLSERLSTPARERHRG